jgi:hypothetical protein
MIPGRKLMALACRAGSWALVVLACGCQVTEPAAVRPRSLGKDPCAERLHDVCGHLLLYYASHKRLPPTLAELKSTPTMPLPPLVCPASGKPYVYDPAGVSIPGRPGRLVLYDPEPSHSGMRWAVMVGTPADATNVTTRVILLPESEFAPANASGDGSGP